MLEEITCEGIRPVLKAAAISGSRECLLNVSMKKKGFWSLYNLEWIHILIIQC